MSDLKCPWCGMTAELVQVDAYSGRWCCDSVACRAQGPEVCERDGETWQERAVATLADVKREGDDDGPPVDEATGCMSHSCLIATRRGGVGVNGPCTCIESSVRSYRKQRLIERALARHRQAVHDLKELKAALEEWSLSSEHEMRDGYDADAVLAWYRGRKEEK